MWKMLPRALVRQEQGWRLRAHLAGIPEDCIFAVEYLKVLDLSLNDDERFAMDTRQWPEVSDFVARFCTLRDSENTRTC